MCVCLWTHACTYAGLSLIETSMCAQALWVNVSSGLGRRPPSSYPSREQSAAKPNMGFTGFDKSSNGTGQKPKCREGEGGAVNINRSCWFGGTGWSACVCVFCCCLRIQKWDLARSGVLLC